MIYSIIKFIDPGQHTTMVENGEDSDYSTKNSCDMWYQKSHTRLIAIPAFTI